MSGVPIFEGQRAAITVPLTAGSIRLPVLTKMPLVAGAIDFAVAEEWINGKAEFLTLPRHHVHGVMEKKRADFAGRFRHENARMGLAPHQDRERSDVILMRVSDQNRVDGLSLDRLQIRKSIIAGICSIHLPVTPVPSC